MEGTEHLAAVLAVTRTKNRAWSQPDRVQELLSAGDPDQVLAEISEQGLFGDPVLDRARRDVETWLSQGIGIVSVLSPDYPVRLREVREAPALLYYEGALRTDDQGVCVVGSRDADDEALHVASAVSKVLVDHGLTVIAGLAAGVDTAAHTSALDAQGRTVAVMGTGLDQTYPRTNTSLRQRITQAQGLVMTQFEPGSRTGRASFPMRNAVMSGYGITTFVVAGTEHSGTRSQASSAVKHGRGVILTPQVAEHTSWGRDLVTSGLASVATSSQDVLDHVHQLQREHAEAEDLLRAIVA
ncbi:MAG: DNA-processing protein DprA [Actinomycetia bacterium]|nr:DNA-processing protein DprA [Actinomycetes bacterium]